MRIVFIFFLIAQNFGAYAQKQKEQLTIILGRIKQSGKAKPTYGPITDTVILTDAKAIKNIQSTIATFKKHGTAEISKCFIPRHALTIYKNDKEITKLLVCFECDGIKLWENGEAYIDNIPESKITDAIREKDMASLSKIFNQYLKPILRKPVEEIKPEKVEQ